MYSSVPTSSRLRESSLHVHVCTVCILRLNQYFDIFIKTNILYVEDINECKSYPCENCGICTDAVNRYACKCAPGYTNKDCRIGMWEQQHW